MQSPKKENQTQETLRTDSVGGNEPPRRAIRINLFGKYFMKQKMLREKLL